MLRAITGPSVSALYVGYLFHHESPLRKPGHVSKKIALAALRIAAGSGEKLELGDITVEKEWTFAGDVAGPCSLWCARIPRSRRPSDPGATHSIKDCWISASASSGRIGEAMLHLKEGFILNIPGWVSDPATIFSLGCPQRSGLPSSRE